MKRFAIAFKTTCGPNRYYCTVISFSVQRASNKIFSLCTVLWIRYVRTRQRNYGKRNDNPFKARQTRVGEARHTVYRNLKENFRLVQYTEIG